MSGEGLSYWLIENKAEPEAWYPNACRDRMLLEYILTWWAEEEWDFKRPITYANDWFPMELFPLVVRSRPYPWTPAFQEFQPVFALDKPIAVLFRGPLK